MGGKRRLAFVAAVSILLPSSSFSSNAVEFCGFKIEVPRGWTHEVAENRSASTLRLQPRCWCELEYQPENAEMPDQFWFISQGRSPILLKCTGKTVQEFLAEGIGNISPSPTGFEVGGAIWGTTPAGPIEGRGWIGFGGECEVRAYYWQGGNAGTLRIFSAAIYAASGPVLFLEQRRDSIPEMEPEYVLALISHP